MAMQQPVKTSSAHRSTFIRGTHTFEIIGYGKLKALGVRNTVRSGDFEAGGHTWALVCCFDVLLPDTNPPHRCQLTSISLKLVSSTNHKDVIAKASLRIDDPAPPSSGKKGCGRRWPPAVWESGVAHSFPATTAARFESYSDDGSDDARSWKLSVPDAFRESLYVKDDRLTIHCTVDVLLQEKVDTAATRNCFVSVVPPPTIPRDLRNLLFQDEPGTTTKSNKPDTRFKTDVTFVVEQTEIHAHRLVLAMRSPVFAAELFGKMKESAACARVTVDDMSASTFKAMLHFIYTDELPGNFHKPKQDNDVTTTTTTTTTTTITTKGLVTMVGDLLVAADRYDLERLRLMCEKILAENMNAASAMTTLMLVHGRDRCRQLEAACIEYMASDPSMYADVVSSKEYKEIKEKCGPFVTDVLEKVWRRALTRDSLPPPPPAAAAPSSSLEAAGSPQKSASMFNSSAVFSGSHEFRIPDFNMMHKIFGVSEHIESSPFQVGGREWIICVYPSGYDGEGFIAMSLQTLTARGPTTNTDGWVTATFKMDDPTGKMPPIICWAENLNGSGTCFLVKKFMDVAATELFYVKYDGSLTIQCDVKVSKGYSYSTSPAAAGSATMTAIIPPSSNIACHLERLLLVSHRPCFDVKFLVQDTAEVYAHELVIAARSPVLHRAIASAPDKDHVQVDDMDVTTFRAMLHFIYADELPPMMMMTMTTMTPVGNHRAGDNLAMARDMLVAADRFGLDRMKAMCENMLCEHVMASNVVATLELADRRGFQGLKDFCLEHISQPHVLKEVAETQSLKDLKTTSPGLLVEIIIKISKLS